MKLSAPDWCFYKGQDPAAYYRALREMGIAGVEMVAPERRDAARAAGLEILNLSGPGMEHGLNDPAYHAELLPQIAATIEEARAADIPAVIVFSGNRIGQSEIAGVAACVAGLRALVPAADAAGVTLLFEMLNDQDHAGYAASSTAYGLMVVTAVGSPRVQMLYDAYHLRRMGEDPALLLPSLLPYIGHIHLAQSPHRSSTCDAGEIDHAALIPPALAAGYDGYWGLEFIAQGDPLQELAAAVQEMRALAEVRA